MSAILVRLPLILIGFKLNDKPFDRRIRNRLEPVHFNGAEAILAHINLDLRGLARLRNSENSDP